MITRLDRRDVLAEAMRRRDLLLGGLALSGLALGGCGSSSSGPEEGTATTTAGDGAEPAATDARRVLVGGQLLLDAALALDLPVAAVAAPSDREGIPPYLVDRAAGVEVLLSTPAIDYEAIAAFGPDLIIAPTEIGDTEALGLLSEVATTVTLDANTATPWTDTLAELGRLTGREAQADELLAGWEERVAAFAAAVGELRSTEVSLTRCFRDSCRYLPGTTSFAGFVLDQLGVARPAAQQEDPEGRPFVEVSLEQVDLLAAELIVLFGSDADDAIAAVEASPIWQTLPAVVAGNVRRADPFAWFQGNVVAAGIVADDLEAWLLELS